MQSPLFNRMHFHLGQLHENNMVAYKMTQLVLVLGIRQILFGLPMIDPPLLNPYRCLDN